jgi:predicted nucleic acid-binding protein
LTKWIVNTSPLQYLHQLECLWILEKFCTQVEVPTAVYDEIQRGIESGVNLPDLDSLAWVSATRPTQTGFFPVIGRLGRGELEVIALGLENHGSILVLDDGLARRHAKRLGLSIKGTLGLLLEAKKRRWIPELTSLIHHLIELGFRIAPQTIQHILVQAGEEASQIKKSCKITSFGS